MQTSHQSPQASSCKPQHPVARTKVVSISWAASKLSRGNSFHKTSEEQATRAHPMEWAPTITRCPSACSFFRLTSLWTTLLTLGLRLVEAALAPSTVAIRVSTAVPVRNYRVSRLSAPISSNWIEWWRKVVIARESSTITAREIRATGSTMTITTNSVISALTQAKTFHPRTRWPSSLSWGSKTVMTGKCRRLHPRSKVSTTPCETSQDRGTKTWSSLLK